MASSTLNPKDVYPSEEELSSDDEKYSEKTRELRRNFRNYEDDEETFIPPAVSESSDSESSDLELGDLQFSDSEVADLESEDPVSQKVPPIEPNKTVPQIPEDNSIDTQRIVKKNDYFNKAASLLEKSDMPKVVKIRLELLKKHPEFCHTKDSIYVPTSDTGGKYYEKEGCCSYCFEVVERKINEHYQSKHKKEPAVARVLKMKYDTKQRKQARRRAWAEIRAPGNIIFNIDKRLNRSGKQIVARRLLTKPGNYCNTSRGRKKGTLSEEKKYENFLLESTFPNLKSKDQDDSTKKLEKKKTTAVQKMMIDINYNRGTSKRVACHICGAFLSPNCLGKHQKNIHNYDVILNKKNLQEKSRSIFQIVSNAASEALQTKVLPSLQDDTISDLLKRDTTICGWLSWRLIQLNEPDHIKQHRGEGRNLAALLEVMKKKYPAHFEEFADGFHARKWEYFADCLREFCEIDPKTYYPAKIGRADKLYTNLPKIIKYLKSQFAIYDDAQDRYEGLLRFEPIFEEYGKLLLGTKARQARKQNDRGAGEEVLPTIDEKRTLMEYNLKRMRPSLKFLSSADKNEENLNENMALFRANYRILLESSSTDLLLFNNRRNCEINRILLKDYQSAKHLRVNDTQYTMMADIYQEQAAKYTRIDCGGKKTEGQASVYLTDENLLAVKILLKYRKLYGVSEENEFLYALPKDPDFPEKHEHVDVYQTLKTIAQECDQAYGKINCKNMKATKFRKLAAEIIDNDPDLQKNKSIHVKHMAHKETTHDKYYRRRTGRIDAETTMGLEKMVSADCRSRIRQKSSNKEIDEHKSAEIQGKVLS